MKQVIRIIGGKYRGKKIYFPDSEGLRPTPDRVRETLFNWLMHRVINAQCLDAFSGSGALGFEAFSRGAAEVTFLEQSSLVYTYLKQNIELFESAPLSLKKTDALQYFQSAKKSFDIIFLDPPFALNCIPECLSLIAEYNLLNRGGVVYTESAVPIAFNELIWSSLKNKKAGQVFYSLFELNPS